MYNIVVDSILQKELNYDSNEIDISFAYKGIYVINILGANWHKELKFIKE